MKDPRLRPLDLSLCHLAATAVSPLRLLGRLASGTTSFQVWLLTLALVAVAVGGFGIGERSTGFERTSPLTRQGASPSHFGAPAFSELIDGETRNFSGLLQELENQKFLVDEVGNRLSMCHYKESGFYGLITAETFVKNNLIDGFFVTCLHWWLEAANKFNGLIHRFELKDRTVVEYFQWLSQRRQGRMAFP